MLACTSTRIDGEPVDALEVELPAEVWDETAPDEWTDPGEPAEPCPGEWCMDPTNTHRICVDVMTDRENCGACAVTCAGACVDGACAACECEGGRFSLANDIDTPCLYTDTVLLGCSAGAYTLTADGVDIPWDGVSLDGCDVLEGVTVVCGEVIEIYGVRL